MMAMGQDPSLVNPPATGVRDPITPQAIVTVNASFDDWFVRKRQHNTGTDICIYPNREVENFSARRHELAFALEASYGHMGINRPAHVAGGGAVLPLFTSLNGFSVKSISLGHLNNPHGKAVAMRSLRKHFRFIGVNLTNMTRATRTAAAAWRASLPA